MERTINFLKHKGVCNAVHYKEQYIPIKEIEGEICVITVACPSP